MTSGCGINPGASPAGVGVTAELDRVAVLDWYRRNRARSAQLFDMLAEHALLHDDLDRPGMPGRTGAWQ